MKEIKPIILWIFGDSWSAMNKEWPDTVWTRLLANRLSNHLRRPVQMRNHSLIGTSQDWITEQYLINTREMSADDYTVILLTSPHRYWFFEDKPDLTNWNIIDFDQQISADQSKSVELYIKHIQREKLDTLHTVNRLGNIAYETGARGLRRPLIVKGFDQDLNVAATYPDLNIAQGYLTQIQYNEYADQDRMANLQGAAPNWFNGFDCRYNHLCVSNHEILSVKLFNALIQDHSPDLTSGFQQNLIKENWLDDKEFCEKQLCPQWIENFLKIQDQKPSPGSIMKAGIEKIFG